VSDGTLAMLLWGLLALAGLAGSATWSGLETGLYALNRVRLSVRRAEGDRAAERLAREVDNPERLLTTLLIANNVSNYLGSLGLAAVLQAAGLGDVGIIVLQAVVLTPMLLVFGESLPKDVFRVVADRVMYPFARVIFGVRMLATVTGVLPLVLGFTKLAGRVLGGEGPAALPDARAMMVQMLKEGGSVGGLSEEQMSMVDRALLFGRTTVRDEMVAWPLVRWVRLDWGRERVLRYMDGSPHSRFPVLDKRGRVVGILPSIEAHVFTERPLEELVRPPVMLSPRMSAREALQRLQEARAHIGIVEQHGRPIGLVTAKDMVEPLTGELAEW